MPNLIHTINFIVVSYHRLNDVGNRRFDFITDVLPNYPVGVL